MKYYKTLITALDCNNSRKGLTIELFRDNGNVNQIAKKHIAAIIEGEHFRNIRIKAKINNKNRKDNFLSVEISEDGIKHEFNWTANRDKDGYIYLQHSQIIKSVFFRDINEFDFDKEPDFKECGKTFQQYNERIYPSNCENNLHTIGIMLDFIYSQIMRQVNPRIFKYTLDNKTEDFYELEEDRYGNFIKDIVGILLNALFKAVFNESYKPYNPKFWVWKNY